jgi:hypothetical protein
LGQCFLAMLPLLLKKNVGPVSLFILAVVCVEWF